MANSKFEYVREFELEDKCLPNCWIVARVDGRNFHRFADEHKFEKPNDRAALELMCQSAVAVMEDFKDVVVAYGQSDEFSFVFRKKTDLFQRRSSKLSSTLVSLFSSFYTLHWSKYFPSVPLRYPPSFDARIILYPSLNNLRDYLSWRQADCHINNLHNTCYWKLVSQSNTSPDKAQTQLGKMLAKDKNELLFSQYNLNYNNIEQVYRKGSVVVREMIEKDSLENSKNKCNIEDTIGSDSNQTCTINESISMNMSKSSSSNHSSETSKKNNDNSDNNNDDNADEKNNPDKNDDNPEEINDNPVEFNDNPDEINDNKNNKKNLKEKAKINKKKQKKKENTSNHKMISRIVTYHTDIIGNSFWNERPYLLEE